LIQGRLGAYLNKGLYIKIKVRSFIINILIRPCLYKKLPKFKEKEVRRTVLLSKRAVIVRL